MLLMFGTVFSYLAREVQPAGENNVNYRVGTSMSLGPIRPRKVEGRILERFVRGDIATVACNGSLVCSITMYHTGKILRRTLASPTVMILELDVPTLPFFRPGQWVDFVVPSRNWIGGFSIASSPNDLPNLTLAIKKSSHLPATWVHEESRIGEEVQVQVGGTCVLSPLSTTPEEFRNAPPSVFLAGGIGISPILSQYREFINHRANLVNSTTSGPAAKLLYTVSDETELVFAEELLGLATSGVGLNANDEMIFSVTQAAQWSMDAHRAYGHAVTLATGRIMRSFLGKQARSSMFYLCGPSGMLDDAVAFLQDASGVDPSNIHYEKWW